MEYLIDNKVIFRVEENALIHSENIEHKIELTLTVSRLLLLLLSHQGQVLPRKTIFKQVWEDYGLEASNNSLSQYISLLRNAFRTLEVQGDTIQTVPRIGFMLSADLQIIELSITEKLMLPNEHVGQSDLNSTQVRSDKLKNPVRLQRLIFSLLSVLLTSLIACISILRLSPEPYSLTPIPLGNYNNCRVLFLPMYEFDLARPSRELIDSVISTSGLSCSNGNDLYIHVDANVVKGSRGKVWVSSCERRKEDGFLQCNDYVSSDWEISK